MFACFAGIQCQSFLITSVPQVLHEYDPSPRVRPGARVDGTVRQLLQQPQQDRKLPTVGSLAPALPEGADGTGKHTAPRSVRSRIPGQVQSHKIPCAG